MKSQNDIKDVATYPKRPVVQLAAVTAVRVVSLGLLLFTFSAIAWGQTVNVREFRANGPQEIATGPDGALWFTEPGNNKIGRITTAGVTTEFSLTPGGRPFDITAGRDGALWFTESGSIGRITTTGVITEYSIPSGLSAEFITAGSDGALWFTVAGSIISFVTTGADSALSFTEAGDIPSTLSRIGRITTAGVVTEYPIVTGNSHLQGITAGPDGAVWFTVAGNDGVGRIGRITTAGAASEFPFPITSTAVPVGITAGPDGALWFTNESGSIGRITTAGVMTFYPLAHSVGGGITIGPDDALWFPEPQAEAMGRITTDGTITEFALDLGLGPSITLGPDRALWFVDSFGIGRLILRPVPVVVFPSYLDFSYVTGGPPPSGRTVSVTSSFPITIDSVTTTGGSWFSATFSPPGVTPTSVFVSVNPSGLAPGNYYGTVIVHSLDATNSPQTVGVSLSVSASLTAVPTDLSFSYVIGSASPNPQKISVASSSPIPITISSSTNKGGDWLSSAPSSGVTPAIINIGINPTGLAPGAYQGTITIRSNLANNILTVPVSLLVISSLRVSPQSLSFRHTIGSSPPAAQSVSVSSDGLLSIQLSITMASGEKWLNATPTSFTSPGRVTVAVNPSGLGVGTYSGTLTFTSPEADQTQTVAVTLTINSSISVSPTALSYSYVIGSAAPQSQSVSVTGASTLNFTVATQTTAGGSWLTAVPASGTTPSTLAVSVNPAALSEGKYSGTVTINARDAVNTPQSVAVTLTVTSVSIAVTNLPSTTPAAQQLPIGISINTALPVQVSGCLVVSFVSDAVVPVDDPNVRFTSSGRMVAFTFPANTTTIPASQLPAIQTGTTAGIITVSGSLQSCGPGLTSTPLQTIRVNRAAPVITSVEMVRTTGGIEVRISGYATSREMLRAQFRFTAGADFDLPVSEVTIDVSNAFQSWYQTPASAAFGSMFRYVQPFTVQGDVNGVQSVTVTLTNAQGSGTSQPSGF
jgi:streptogramin lyase